VIYQWKKTRVPADRCPDVEQLTGVRCEDLRPDVNWAVVRGGSVESTKQGA
jgi:DNA-binding transcriptional regulator YdaS (Cro superfamily)